MVPGVSGEVKTGEPNRPIGRLLAAATILTLASCSASGPILAPGPPEFAPEDLLDVLAVDHVPAVLSPGFEEAARSGFADEHPVAVVRAGGEVRAFPLGVLLRHEIVDARVGGTEVAVTHSPLCGSTVVFSREAGRRSLTFAVSGKLYRGCLVAYDRETRSLWPQQVALAVRGPLAGARLDVLPAAIVSLGEFRSAHPDGLVLSPPSASAPYETTPYPGYASRSAPFTSLTGAIGEDGRLPAMTRVVGVRVGAEARAYSLSEIRQPGGVGVVHDRLGGRAVVLFAGGAAASITDAAEFADAEAGGGSAVFDPGPHRFHESAGRIRDRATGSVWNLLGEAVAGPLKGARLEGIVHLDAFWFAWSAEVPETEVWSPRPAG